MGHGAWGMGHWALGIGHWALGIIRSSAQEIPCSRAPYLIDGLPENKAR
ncbi:MAG: hypothetical protein KME33_34175 [Aetokthonos hydrillicola CCALA 1050]|nr:hypothetical protein [Aetokthonos hydrillicola CCALA 1050]